MRSAKRQLMPADSADRHNWRGGANTGKTERPVAIHGAVILFLIRMRSKERKTLHDAGMMTGVVPDPLTAADTRGDGVKTEEDIGVVVKNEGGIATDVVMTEAAVPGGIEIAMTVTGGDHDASLIAEVRCVLYISKTGSISPDVS
jgi:hypothetical protein